MQHGELTDRLPPPEEREAEGGEEEYAATTGHFITHNALQSSSPNDVVGWLDARGGNRRTSAPPFARCPNVRGPAGSLHINLHDAW